MQTEGIIVNAEGIEVDPKKITPSFRASSPWDSATFTVASSRITAELAITRKDNFDKDCKRAFRELKQRLIKVIRYYVQRLSTDEIIMALGRIHLEGCRVRGKVLPSKACI
jgi:hypothetical protein